ncbi:hypothetical protein [Actinopolymorpha singaporensis]|uniref:hypothetical protein n=1 Tax=Actinopolymorpha singaporensis TaxID=117157 RepID=UPI000B824650|nr:hypothetical protein [Actinopolymorpha singaporensis]
MSQPHPGGRHVGHDRLRTLLSQLPSEPARPRPDAVLLADTRSGDADAYAELLRRHEPAGRLLLASLPEDTAGDAAPSTAEDRLRAAGDQVLATVHAGTGPRAAFRPFFLRAVLRVSTATSLEEGNGLRRSDPEQDAADKAIAHLPESVLTALWHSAVEHDSPERLAVVLGTEAADAAVAGYRAEAAFRRVYVRHLLDEREDTPEQCREILEVLGRHTFEGLYDEEAQHVTGHLEVCANCTEMHRRLVAAGAALPERLAGLVLGPHASGYLTALRREGAPVFAVVDPAARPLGPRPATASWSERLSSSGRQLWTGSWTGAWAGSWAGSSVLRGRTAGVAALGVLAAASVATLAWGTVAMIGGSPPVTDAEHAPVPGSTAGDTAGDGPPEDDWMGFVQDSPTAPAAGVLVPTPTTDAVTPEAVEAARPAARSNVVVDRRSAPRTKPTVTDGPLPTAPVPTPSRTATSAPVPPPEPAPQPTRTSTPAPPPPSHSSPPTSEPSPPPTSEPSPPPTTEPSPPPTTEPSPPPTSDPTPPPADPTPPPDTPA